MVSVNITKGNDTIGNVTIDTGTSLRSGNGSTQDWHGSEDFIGLDMLIPVTEVKFNNSF